MKKILGLDLGTASVGWSVIEEKTEKGKIKTQILGLGSRIIPYEGTEGKDFAKGTGESRNSLRTKARTARKGYDRYQLRRKYLVESLGKTNMFPNETLKNLPKIELWALRNNAVYSEIALQELGRLLLWFNQKRGYKSSRSDANLGKKDTEYVSTVKSRHEKIKELNLTIGQYFYKELSNDPFFKVKENIFPREAYIEEFDAIWQEQSKHHLFLDNCSEEILNQIAKGIFPGEKQEHYRQEVIKGGLYNTIRNMIVYNQRPLKSQKGLVSVCEFEGFWRTGKDGKEYFVGPKSAPKSSPIYQLSKMWENVNNIKVGSRSGGDIEISVEQKQAIFQHLDNNEKLTVTDLLKILKLDKKNCYINKQVERGLVGNITKHAIRQCFGNSTKYNHLLNLNLHTVETEKKGYLIDKKTGEILDEKSIKFIDAKIEQEQFYQLWHIIYSIQDKQECSNALQAKFSIEPNIADNLAEIDFSKYAFGNKSAKVIRKILPYLMEGNKYSEAMSYAGYEHSDSLTKDENLKRKLLDTLKPIQKNSLRQPIVEKILNQMVNVVNAIIEKYGKPDEIRVELARELKQSKDERNEAEKKNTKRQRENENITKRLAEYGLKATRNNILKWRLYEEIDNEEKKLNAVCIYCGQPISLTEAIKGNDVDIEHIIPKSKLFDDSQSNKTLAHRHCNKNKNDLTAYDFMKSKPTAVLEAYIERVNSLYANHVINKAKRDKLLMTEEKIPDNFIDRQLRETQYISRKAREILQTICYNVWATSGTVTSELRHLWGWDEITMNLQFEKYKQLGLTEIVEWQSEHGKNKHQKEVISGWTKRDDHRHHAIDALTIACTKQGYIQRLNTLTSEKTQEDFRKALENCTIDFKEKRSKLEKYIISEQPISTAEVEDAVANILISFKSGKKVAVIGTRKAGKLGNKKIVQTGIIIPRGSLHEEGVYGSIKQYKKESSNKHVSFENQIVKKYKLGVGSQGFIFTGKETYEQKEKINKKTGEETKVIIDKFQRTLDSIVDNGIRKVILNRLNFGFDTGESYKTNSKKALDNLKDLENNPIYLDVNKTIPIKSVRCFTGLSAVVPIKKDENGKDIGFVKSGNNHHIAIYTDRDGKKVEHLCTFWHAVERKKYGIPIIIKSPLEVWSIIEDKKLPESFLNNLPFVDWTFELSMQQNEMIILGIDDIIIKDILNAKNIKMISKYLYNIQNLSEKQYRFSHHLETKFDITKMNQPDNRFYNIRSVDSLFKLNPVKLKIDRLGNISL
ncbi:MAG: type II CRISPR RNA-guided endonuclease Cas9 [Paludibacter sp.]|nr:type II CRISPR RNA-guided endonuclease Cas9 [Paludibacter sp.]